MTSIDDYRARGEDAPLDLVRDSADWKPVIRLIDGWATEKLSATSGYSSRELDDRSRARAVRFPPVLREWWRLAGRHPFVDPGLMSANAAFISPPHSDLIRTDWLTIAIDDVQTHSGNGIHLDFLSLADPPVHGVNGTIGPDDAPRLNWYKGRFIATELRIPAIVFATLLSHLFEPSDLVVETAAYLGVDRQGLRGGQPDEKLVMVLGLRCFPNPTIVGDLYSDGEDIIYWWMMGFACRTAEAADRVRQIVPTRARSIYRA